MPAGRDRWLARLGLAAAIGAAALLPSPAVAALPSACRPPRTPEVAPPAQPAGEATPRRLALIVGIGSYQNRAVVPLFGAAGDAERFRTLLTGKHGYGFSAGEVCVLLDHEATLANFRQAFDRFLVRRARPGDVVAIYFAGHGSQQEDGGGDEPDGLDETLVFYDSRSPGGEELTDDELRRMLGRLHARTRNITVFLDACSSGSSTRDLPAGLMTVRGLPPARASSDRGSADASLLDLSDPKRPGLPGLVTLSAAADGSAAFERAGRGVFTDALLTALAEVGTRPLTYAQAARRIAAGVRARASAQIPLFQGDLGRIVFGHRERARPLAWEVTRVGGPAAIELAGPPLPGVGRSAELRVYPGSLAGPALRDPGAARALVVIERFAGVTATARILGRRRSAGAIEVGDLAVLVRPSEKLVRLSVRMRPAHLPGGLEPTRAGRLAAAIESHPAARWSVRLAEGEADFELARSPGGPLVLVDPSGRTRNEYAPEEEAGDAVAASLAGHARQRALLHLRGEGGADFEDHRTLQVTLVPAAADSQSRCSPQTWTRPAPGAEQVVPLCQAWHVRVAVDAAAPHPLLVGAVVLAGDGRILALPKPTWHVRIEPGSSYVFRDDLFRGIPPVDVLEQVIAFGTQERNPIPWHLLASTAGDRAGKTEGAGPLFFALRRYLAPAERGEARQVDEDTTWTLGTLAFRVSAGGRPVDLESVDPEAFCMVEHFCAARRR